MRPRASSPKRFSIAISFLTRRGGRSSCAVSPISSAGELSEISAVTDLPFAQPTGVKRNAPWKQLAFFTRSEGHALIRRRIRNLHDDHAEIVRLGVWCVDKFGDAPSIPELPAYVDEGEDDPIEPEDA